jgi:hypothetical protein
MKKKVNICVGIDEEDHEALLRASMEKEGGKRVPMAEHVRRALADYREKNNLGKDQFFQKEIK